MLLNAFHIALGLLLLNGVVAPAHAADNGAEQSVCKRLADLTQRAKDTHGTIRPLTHDEYEFMRGIYALYPTTPPGLPPGDRAIMLSPPDGEGSSMILFVDGTSVCTPIAAPKELLDLLKALPKPGAHLGAPA
jgi:hypothetical protein